MPFKTLADLQKNEPTGDDDDASDNEYYAGGESSGQTIRGNPGRDRSERAGSGRSSGSANRMVSAILDRARQHSERTLSTDGTSSTQGNLPFTGTGYRLGDADTSSTEVLRPGGTLPATRARVVTKTITFFRNGFVVDDGNLRRFDDPEQAAFLADIHAGLVPRELEEPDLGELNVNLVDRSFEDYRPASMSSSPPSRKPFQGDGYRLGEAPTALAASTSSKTQSIPANGSDGAVQPDDLDPNAPITQVQVRLADGTRLVTRMNISHRIADLRRLICAHRSDYAEQAFVFQTVLPRRPLEEESMTLADANLLNAVVMQQLLPQ